MFNKLSACFAGVAVICLFYKTSFYIEKTTLLIFSSLFLSGVCLLIGIEDDEKEDEEIACQMSVILMIIPIVFCSIRILVNTIK